MLACKNDGFTTPILLPAALRLRLLSKLATESRHLQEEGLVVDGEVLRGGCEISRSAATFVQ